MRDTHMLRILNEEIDFVIYESDTLSDIPEDRIKVLEQLRKSLDNNPGIPEGDRFNWMTVINSEISVQRVRTHIRQLKLF